ncbi:hypothetical protein ACZ87_02151 [Candidatus Erwinia dacicola]|uniref:Uncharacterized protein n=1 Tax=Candidatus Erwinia dacicola TaxID=252393 RepID=A0A328TTG5_9GAMM|nr:hypothetical protein ACZ87_02151 [Candidatus Erwinia dacicola]
MPDSTLLLQRVQDRLGALFCIAILAVPLGGHARQTEPSEQPFKRMDIGYCRSPFCIRLS